MKKHALIIGASQGIGFGLSNILADRDWNVTGTYRSTTEQDPNPAITWLKLDINDTDQYRAFCEQLQSQQYDAIIINAGIHGPHCTFVDNASDEDLFELYKTNTISPMRLASKLLPYVKPDTGVLGFTSSLMGSLNENTEAAMPIYSSSKSALNMLIRSLRPNATEHGITLLSLHPGWVSTRMGGEVAPVSVDASSIGLAKVIENAQGKQGHHFLDFQGKSLSW
ncbi:SDR family NAD(P)-dependent oxidoreductase [Vibrio palustris]|uniref:C-factor n=1 Tax=Vibrio palustris TaxID=1918946 RepID=A0A1R4B1N5_9VIBR|nr:SDR family NAD(P)-dependent oxidoreductase [Vibrio palustris]SJL82829.1 C-factor [Vibrio palustris]